jgi:hypothetical protein
MQTGKPLPKIRECMSAELNLSHLVVPFSMTDKEVSHGNFNVKLRIKNFCKD